MHTNNIVLALSVLLLSLSAPLKAADPIAAVAESNAEADTSGFYNETRLYDGKISFFIPAVFSLMSSELKSIKYPNAQQIPDVVYTNEKASVNIAFNLKNYPTTAEDLPQIKEIFEKQLAAVKPESFISQIKTINGYEYVIYEFVSSAVDTKIYNLMFLTDLDGQLLIGTFNCTARLRDEWKDRGREILMSAKKPR